MSNNIEPIRLRQIRLEK